MNRNFHNNANFSIMLLISNKILGELFQLSDNHNQMNNSSNVAYLN